MSCLPHVLKSSKLGKQLGLSKDTAFNTIAEIRDLIDSKLGFELSKFLIEIEPKVEPIVEITKSNYTRQEVQNNLDTAYVFTENTHSITAFPDRSGGGSAVIRPEPNAFAIVTKKKYDYNTRENLDYTNTDSNFKEFTDINNKLIQELKNSGKSKIVFPQGFATDKAKMPTRFAEWLQKELLNNFGLVTELNDTKTGLISKSVNQPTEIESKVDNSNKINIYAGTGENSELSNFAIRPFVSSILNSQQFTSVEQAFQYAKEKYYNIYAIDPSSKETPDIMRAKVEAHLKNILAAKTGAEAKALGRKNIGVDFESEIWDEQSSSIMKKLIKESFEQNPDATAKLLATGNAELTHTQDKGKWGTEFPKLLMEVRSELSSLKTKVEPIVEIEVEETESPFLDTVSDVYGNIVNSFNVSLPIINNDMDGALPETPVAKTKVEELTKEDMLNKGQKEALDKAMVVIEREVSDSIQDNMFLISGKGGTGKTYLTEVLIDKILDNNRYERIAHVAPTWNAVNEIKKASSKDDYEAITLASFLGTTLSEPDESGIQYFLLKDENTIEEAYSKWGTIPALYTSDIIILDEASMIGGNGERPVKNQRGQIVSSDAWQTVLYRLNHRERMGLRKPKKIILVGDYAQIPPVGTSEDRDAEIMEIMMSSMDTHHVLTENMRTNKEDLHRLHELYRNNIDTARAELKNGVPSNVSIQRNPLPYDKRRNTNNIEFANNLEMAVDKFVELFNQAPSDVTNVVFINYNNYNRPETQSLINKIRIKLFRENAGLDYNENELVLLKGNLKSKIMYKGKKVEVTWHNETRFILNNVKQNAVHEFNEVVKYWENGRPMSKRIKISFNGLNANMTTEFGKEIITFNTFIPDKGEIAKVFGPYNSAKKGYVVNGETIPYGTYLKIMESMPNLEYGYVVNGHKVQGSSYNNVIVDESNIMKSPMTNKEFNNSAYTSFSRPRNYLMIYNISNPSDVAPSVSKTQVSPFANIIEIAERLFIQSSSKESKSNIAKTMEDLDRNPNLFDGLTREAYSKMSDEEKAAVVFNKLNC